MRRPVPFRPIPAPVRGALWMTAAALCVAGMAVLVRRLARELPPLEIAFLRVVFGFAFLAPLIVRGGRRRLTSRNHRFYLMRGLASAVFLMTFFPGVALLAVADALALSFTEPLFGALLAVLFLGERARPARVAAVLVGFAGALVILRPGFAQINVGAQLVLIAALASSASNTINKFTTRTDHPDTVVLFHSLYMLPPILVAALVVWTWPTIEQVLWLVAISALGFGAQQGFTRGFAAADASVVLPFHFTRLPFAAVLGFLVFGEFPDIWVWLGGTVIFAASILLVRSESRQRRDHGVTPPSPC